MPPAGQTHSIIRASGLAEQPATGWQDNTDNSKDIGLNL